MHLDQVPRAHCSLALDVSRDDHPLQVAQGGCGCLIPAGIKARLDVALGSLVCPAHSRGLELGDHCGPFQPRPFYDSIIL